MTVTAPQAFWSWLNHVNDHWRTAQLGQLPDMPAPLQKILWTLQKLKSAFARVDKAGLRSNVKDMLMRIDEGVKTGALSSSDAQSLRRIAISFSAPSTGWSISVRIPRSFSEQPPERSADNQGR